MELFTNCLLVEDSLLYKMLDKEYDNSITKFLNVKGYAPKNIKHINASSVGGLKSHKTDEGQMLGVHQMANGAQSAASAKRGELSHKTDEVRCRECVR